MTGEFFIPSQLYLAVFGVVGAGFDKNRSSYYQSRLLANAFPEPVLR